MNDEILLFCFILIFALHVLKCSLIQTLFNYNLIDYSIIQIIQCQKIHLVHTFNSLFITNK